VVASHLTPNSRVHLELGEVDGGLGYFKRPLGPDQHMMLQKGEGASLSHDGYIYITLQSKQGGKEAIKMGAHRIVCWAVKGFPHKTSLWCAMTCIGVGEGPSV
jgi:hypothetical protein